MAPLKVGYKPKIRTDKEIAKLCPEATKNSVLKDFLKELRAIPQAELIVTECILGGWLSLEGTYDTIQIDVPESAQIWGAGQRGYPSVLFQPMTSKRR